VKTLVNRIAGLGIGLMAASSAVTAYDFNPEKSYGAKCYSIVSEYAGGMASIEATKSKSTGEQVTAVATEFKSIMSAAEQSRRCYLQMMKAEESDMYQDELKMGAFKSGVIFETAQAQFSAWIDDMSLVLLNDVAPAAGEGAEANLEAEAQMESGMELLIDSYMLLEDAELLGAKMNRLGNRSD
jgi:hypothetical protein